MLVVLWRRCGLRLVPSPCLPASCRGFQWSGETHYDVLGVLPTASPREIKVAYLGLSKQLHPDVNQGKDDKDTFTIHQKFVRVNQVSLRCRAALQDEVTMNGSLVESH